jgi:nitrogen fixation NifU-like protein
MNNDEKELFDDLEGLVVEEARKIYSSAVLDHFLHPRNLGTLESPDGFAMLSGICGDTIAIFVGMDQNKIRKASFVTNGCGPTIACGSAVTCIVDGHTIEEAMELTGKDLIDYLGGLPIENTHCADLAVNTLHAALKDTGSKS